MDEEKADIRRGLVAERRSLLITSFVLFFYQQAGLTIEKINVLGNEAKIADPWWISFGLWLLWGYFFLRFYQYFRSTPDKGFNAAYLSAIRKFISRSAFRRFKKSFVPEEEDRCHVPNFKIGVTEFPMTFPQMGSVKMRVDIAYSWGGHVKLLTKVHEEDVTGPRLRWMKAKAVLSVLVSTHVATEYALPFIVGLLPLVNLLHRNFR